MAGDENKEQDSKGWICLYRKIQDCWIWEDKPYSYGQAWTDLLLLANHRDKRVLFNGDLITIKKGQRLTSIRQLGERWGWSRTKVSKFIGLLETDKMITRESDNKKTLITVVNYEVYQNTKDTEKTQKSRRGDTEETQKDTNNNYNNYNNENNNNPPYPPTGEMEGEPKGEKPKKNRKEFVPPTAEEVQAYCNSRGNGISGEAFIDHYAARGWKYNGGIKMVDWKAAVRTWEQKRGFKYQKPTTKKEEKNNPNAGLDKYNPDDPMDKIKHPSEDGWRINNDSYWYKI